MKKRKETPLEMQNRTGVLIAPKLAVEMVRGVNEFSPESDLDQSGAAAMRAVYVKEKVPIGSRPVVDDPALTMLLDKLGARLAFERSGVRLYDALIQKVEAAGKEISGMTKKELQHIRDEELEHMHMLEESITGLGGDPTMLTPCADVTAVLSSGPLKVVADPRTTITQCLDAILTAELVDNDSWSVLIRMMEDQGIDDDIEDFHEALTTEQEHLEKVRGWVLKSATSESA